MKNDLLNDLFEELNENSRCDSIPTINIEKLTEPKEVIPMVDVVNHPSHYETGTFECIDVMIETQGKEAVMDFCLCKAFKYLYRHRRTNGVEDIKKARWYVNKYIELAESEVAGE